MRQEMTKLRKAGKIKNLVLTSLCFIAFFSCGRKPESNPSAQTIKNPAARKSKVTAITAKLQSVNYSIEAVGTLEAVEEIYIPAPVSGVVDTVNFKEGDRVDSNTILIEIDVQKYSLTEQKLLAQYERTQAQARLAETLYENRKKLHEEGVKLGKNFVTDEQLVTFRADVLKAKADLSQAKADHELAKKNLTDARVKPPLSGVIDKKMVSKGQYVQVGTVVGTILDLSTLHLRFFVTEFEASKLNLEQEVNFSVKSVPDKKYKSKIFYISQKASESTRAIECKAVVLDKDDSLRAGYFADVKIITRINNSLVLPERAVLPTKLGFLVYIIQNSTVMAKPVKLGLRSPSGIEILTGLSPGEVIAVDGIEGLQNGSLVEIEKFLDQEPGQGSGG